MFEEVVWNSVLEYWYWLDLIVVVGDPSARLNRKYKGIGIVLMCMFLIAALACQ